MKPGAVARLLAAVLLGTPLAACGEGTAVDVSEAQPQASTLVEAPWLLRVTSLGDDEAMHRARYVWFTPATGDVEVIDAGTYFESAAGRETTLLVDAGRSWAVSASLPQWNDRPPQVIDLSTGSTRDLEGDLGRLRAWSFDPEQPGLLRTVTRAGDVRSVEVTTGETTDEGRLLERRDEYGYFFDVETGRPYVVSMAGEGNRPATLGERPDAPVQLAGGRLVFGPILRLPPAQECQSEAGFAAEDGHTTVFCLRGRELSARTAPPDGEPTLIGAPVDLGFQGAEIDFALPPVR